MYCLRLLRPQLLAATRHQLRTIFIQTEATPNSHALKFLPSQRVLPRDFKQSSVEYVSPRSTLAPPHSSPLAAKLLNLDGVASVLYGHDYITVSKSPDAQWAHLKPEVFSLITEAVTAGEDMIISNKGGSDSGDANQSIKDSLQHEESDGEVIGMIKELLETRIRPSIQEDGGDIEFHGFQDGIVLLKLRGACRTCDSSVVTLKNGIENMLMHYIEEVKGVRQVFDEEEEASLREFEKFEAELRRKPHAA